MLVVTRRRNESIIIGDGIEIRVLRTGREGVKLGISAPLSVAVHRKEIYDVIREANTSAAERPAASGTLVHRLFHRAGAKKQP